MAYLPILSFALATVGGITLVAKKYHGKRVTMNLAIVHGMFAAAGMVILVINVIMDTSNILMNISLVLFAVAALGGFIVFSFHIRKKPA
jgi:hypothetical protein